LAKVGGASIEHQLYAMTKKWNLTAGLYEAIPENLRDNEAQELDDDVINAMYQLPSRLHWPFEHVIILLCTAVNERLGNDIGLPQHLQRVDFESVIAMLEEEKYEEALKRITDTWHLKEAHHIFPNWTRPRSQHSEFQGWFKPMVPMLDRLCTTGLSKKAIEDLFIKEWQARVLQSTSNVCHLQERDVFCVVRYVTDKRRQSSGTCKPAPDMNLWSEDTTEEENTETEDQPTSPNDTRHLSRSSNGSRELVHPPRARRPTSPIPQRRTLAQQSHEVEQDLDGSALDGVSGHGSIQGSQTEGGGIVLNSSDRNDEVRSPFRHHTTPTDQSAMPPDSSRAATPVRPPARTGKARTKTCSCRAEPYARSMASSRSLSRRRRTPESDVETENIVIDEMVLTFGRTPAIPVQLTRVERAELFDSQVDMAEEKRQMHVHGQEMHTRGGQSALEARNEHLLEGTKLQLQYQKRLEELLEGAGQGRSDT
jgi:hypothetical protein